MWDGFVKVMYLYGALLLVGGIVVGLVTAWIIDWIF